jgi:hypothetical protein
MSITLLIICIVLVLYVGACVYQFRRLSRDEEKEGLRGRN